MTTSENKDEPSVPIDREKEFLRGRRRTQVLINSANIIDNADAQMLSALYQPIQLSLGFNLTQLGAITTARALLQSASTPIWGWFSDKFSRKKILSLGCLLWGLFTIVLAFLSKFWGLLLIRAMTGLGLAVIVPTSQSLIADYFHESKRGAAFGYIGLTGVLGAIVGTLYATAIGSITILGLEGWRFAFITLGGVSVVLGVFVWIFGRDPIRGRSEEEIGDLVSEQTEEVFTIQLADYKKILTNKTFLLIVFQGVAGLIPWNSILFVIYWFEHIGFNPVLAGITFSVIAIGAAFGNLFGGWLGDKAAQWKPDKGRIMVAQISVFSGIPMMFIIFLLIPREATTTSLILFIFVGIITGFLISWCAPAANNPIFSELFEPEIRSTAFSVDRLFEGSVAASGTLIVALLAEGIFGYVQPDPGGIDTLPQDVLTNNINAIAYALIISTCVPWFLCLIIYSFAYRTYPEDREACKQRLLERKKVLEREGEPIGEDIASLPDTIGDQPLQKEDTAEQAREQEMNEDNLLHPEEKNRTGKE